jgi:hypothetical protein
VIRRRQGHYLKTVFKAYRVSSDAQISEGIHYFQSKLKEETYGA